MSPQRKKNIAKNPLNALATAVGYVKTIQINLGGMKAAELRGSCVKTHSATKNRTLFSDPSTVRYKPREEENQQLVNPSSTLNL
jgi:hypothetical protein